MTLRGERRGDVDLRRRRGDEVHPADVAPLPQIELSCLGQIHVQRRRSVLVGLLRRIIERELAAGLDIGRTRIDAVELRDLIPIARDVEASWTRVFAEVALIAPADVVGGTAKQPRAVGLLDGVTRAGQDDAVAQIFVALEARRIAGDAAEAS